MKCRYKVEDSSCVTLQDFALCGIASGFIDSLMDRESSKHYSPSIPAKSLSTPSISSAPAICPLWCVA